MLKNESKKTDKKSWDLVDEWSWIRAAIFFAVLLGFPSILIYGWPKGEWSFGWGMVGAVGTLVVGGVAIQISYKQTKWMSEKRRVSTDLFMSRVSNINLKSKIDLNNLAVKADLLKENKDLGFGFFVADIRCFIVNLREVSDELGVLLESSSLSEVDLKYYDEVKKMRCCYYDMNSKYKTLVAYSFHAEKRFDDEFQCLVTGLIGCVFDCLDDSCGYFDFDDREFVLAGLSEIRSFVFSYEGSLLGFLGAVREIN